MKTITTLLSIFLIHMFMHNAALAAKNKEVNLYSIIRPVKILPILKRFTKKYGIKVNYVYQKSKLIRRLKIEDRYTVADLVIVSNLEKLLQLQKFNLLKRVESTILKKQVPAKFRHRHGLWYGLSSYSRLIIAHKLTDKDEVKTYDDLTKPGLYNRVCIRSLKHTYNITLFAAMISQYGEEKTKRFIQSLKRNLVYAPKGNDRGQAQAIYQGFCDYTIINSYYYSLMLQNKDQNEWAKNIRIIMPNQKTNGVFMNISGIAVSKYAKNTANALMLIEFLTEPQNQIELAHSTLKFPVNRNLNHKNNVLSAQRYDNTILDSTTKNREIALKIIEQLNSNK